MTQDVTAGIGIQIDSAGALDQLRQLQAGISQFNQSVISTNSAAVARQRDLISSFAHQVEATKQFSAGITNVESSVHRLGKSIDTSKLKLGEYFTYGLAASGKFNNAFAKKHSEIMQVATDRVKRLQTQYVALGESSNGMTKALAVRPLNLFNAQAAITTQRMQLFNKLMADGTTSLINWGKNTQWAGRQLMVGFTVPLTVFGAMAAKTFTDIEKAMVSFKRVYGDTMTTDAETNKALENVKALAVEYTKYGIAVSDTIQLGAKAAALGAEGPDLIAQTEQATRLATLGQIDYQQALDTTISLQTAFGISAQDLGSNIDFLNAVENQTVLSIDDITESIPKVAPVIKALGGNVKDLTYMLTAMREGGVNAAEGSNALKSGLMSLINPTQAAIDKAKELGIDLQGIVQANNGDLPGMIKAMGTAFNSIDDSLAKQQLMGKIFGKYQVARMTAMFENISKEGGQASRVLDLMGRSTQSLATLSEKELGKVENAVSTKWAGSIERLKAEIAPVGELFLKMATPVVDVVSGMVKWFNELNPVVKNVGVIMAGAFLVALPVVTMLVGLFANMFGNILKGVIFFKNLGSGFRKAGHEAGYLATAQLDTIAAAASLETAEAKLEGRTSSLTSQLNVQRSAMKKLTAAYLEMTSAAMAAVSANPKGFRISKIKGYAKGRVNFVPGSGNGKTDSELAMLAPGEAVINAEDSRRYAPLLAAINEGKIPGYAKGKAERNPVTSSINGQSFEWLPMNLGKGKTNAPKMEMLLGELEATGIDLSREILQIFKELHGEFVSVNEVVRRISTHPDENVQRVAGKYASVRGDNAPNDMTTRKTKILKNNPEMAAYFGEQFNVTKSATEQWAKRNGLAITGGGLDEDHFGTHISHNAKAKNKAGEKLWMAGGVNIDSGFINRYLEDTSGAVQRMTIAMKNLADGTGEVDKGMKQAIKLYLKKFGGTVEQAREELMNLAQTLHATTPGAVNAVRAIAQTDVELSRRGKFTGKTALGTRADLAYKAYAAQRAAQYSLENNGSAFVQSSIPLFAGVKPVAGKDGKFRNMGEAEAAAAAKTVDSIISSSRSFSKKFATLNVSLEQIEMALKKSNNAFQIASPSKKIKKLGKGIEDGSTIAAESISKAEKKLRKQLQQMSMVDDAALVSTTPAKKTKKFGRLNPLSSFGAGATVDSALFALSMVPGAVGEFSQKLLFATMGLQAFSGVLSGLAAVSGAAKAGSLLAPIAKFAPLAGTALGALVSPAGIAVASLAALGGVAWLVYNHYVEQEKALKAFGEAVKTSTTTLSGFATKFGYSETISSISTRTVDTDKGYLQRAVTAQSAVNDQMANDEAFKTKMENLKNATEAQAEIILRQTFLSLIASGAPADVAKSIVEQMANEVNKGAVFQSINTQLTDAIDQNGKVKDVAKTISSVFAPSLDKAFHSSKALAEQIKIINDIEARRDPNNVSMKTTQGLSPEDLEALNKAKDAVSKIQEEFGQMKAGTSDVIEQVVTDLNRLFNAGLIDENQMDKGFQEMKKSVEGVFPNDTIAQAKAYSDAISGLNESIKLPAQFINDASVAAATLNAVMSGADPSDINAALTSAAGNANVATAALNALTSAALSNPIINGTAGTATLEAQIAATKAQIANLSKGSKKKTGGGGGGGSTPKSKYDKKSDAIAKANARLDIAEVKIDKTEDAKIQAAMDKRWGGKTIEIDGLKVTVKNAADIEYAMQQIDETIEDINRNQVDPLNDKLDDLHDKQDAINRQIDLYQQEIDKINEAYDAQSKPLERANDLLQNQQSILEEQRDKQLEGIDLQTTALQNQIDTAQYAAQVQGQLIDDQIEKNNVNLDLIQKQIDAIGDQLDALEAVKQINDILAAQKQSQLGLASALSSGDAGAAASAMLDSQSTAASGASQLQQAGLQAQQDQLQSQADAITAQNDLLSKRKDAIDKGVDGLNRQLAALTQQRTVIENNYKLELQGIANSIAENSARLRQLDYERTTRTAYWQDQIDRYAPALRDLDNQIYAIEQQIKKIQDEKISPLEKQKDLLSDIAGDVKDQISREKAVIDQKRKQLDYSNKINSAMKTLYDKARSAAGATGGIGSALGGANSEMDKLTKKLAEYESQLKTAKFQIAVKQGLVVRDSKGRIRQFDSFQGLQAFMSTKEGVGAKYVSVNELQGGGKVDGKEYKSYDSLARAITNKMDNKITKPIVLELFKDPDKDSVKVKTKKTGSDILYSLSGGPWFGKARGGLIPGKGGILPGFRGVAHGDDRVMMMRSGEGVTVSEALRANKYESQRLLALNRAALSGNMGGFYREWSAPELTNTVANIQPVATTSGATVHNEYNFDISGGPNVNTDELVNKVVYKIKESQRGQIRSM